MSAPVARTGNVAVTTVSVRTESSLPRGHRAPRSMTVGALSFWTEARARAGTLPPRSPSARAAEARSASRRADPSGQALRPRVAGRQWPAGELPSRPLQQGDALV